MAGSGKRMGYSKNKILLPFDDKYLFEIPLNTFLSLGYEVICVVSKEDIDIIKPLLKNECKCVLGGATRQESVYNGLKVATGDYVLVHDAARMFVKKELILKMVEESKKMIPTLAYTEVKDTIKINENGRLVTLNRRNLIAAATPQGAPLKLFLEVYKKAIDDSFMSTDDISLIEKYHPELEVKLILADDLIFKVTTPKDYDVALDIWRKMKW